jgi:hypothetical protein
VNYLPVVAVTQTCAVDRIELAVRDGREGNTQNQYTKAECNPRGAAGNPPTPEQDRAKAAEEERMRAIARAPYLLLWRGTR